jgi:predicted HTH transcriptional regulator
MGKDKLAQGETTTVQFKIRSEEAYKMGVEMVAFSNTQGGILVVGVDCNKLLFENAKDILPYTGIGSGIMRAMQSYDKISFKNDFVREEFITTLKRDEIPDELIVDIANFGVNEGISNEDEGINEKNEAINLHFEAINEAIKNELIHVLSLISNNPMIKRSTLEQMMKKSNATVERYLKMLKERGLIAYIGSDKTGGYKIKQANHSVENK